MQVVEFLEVTSSSWRPLTCACRRGLRSTRGRAEFQANSPEAPNPAYCEHDTPSQDPEPRAEQVGAAILLRHVKQGPEKGLPHIKD